MPKTKPKRAKPVRRSYAKFILPTIVGLLVIAVIVLAGMDIYTRMQIPKEYMTIKQMVITAVDNLTEDIPTDAKTGVLYIAPAKLSLPAATDYSLKLRYNYLPADNATLDSEIHIASKENINLATAAVLGGIDLKSTFEKIPKLQACSRGYMLKFTEAKNKEDYGSEVFRKTLKDGRIIYVYLDKGCTDNNDKLLPYLKQIESY